jgi:hypothetical protein
MIVYQLRCSNGHEFDAWFRDGATYDQQGKDGNIGCPHCSDTMISKAVMAPNIATHRTTSLDMQSSTEFGSSNFSDHGNAEIRAREVAAKILAAVGQIGKHVAENCDDVGDEFAAEARRIHYGDAEERGIYGQATEQEAEELGDEGIDFHRLPRIRRRDS